MTVEADLLEAIVAGDEASRLVYHDWLETHAQRERAEFLRLDRAVGPGQHAQLKEVAASPRIDPAWRRLVNRFPIAGCAQAGCPRDWSGLRATARDDARRCGVCEWEIPYAETSEVADELARAGTPYVVDIVVAPAWIRTNAWQSGDYTALVRQLYPEATGPHPIEVQRPLRSFSMIVRAHTLNHLYFGWSAGTGSSRFQSWSGLFAMGPLGFARVSQRPSVVRDLLVAERVELPRPNSEAYLHLRTAEELAGLLSPAYEAPSGPDEWRRPDRDLCMRSGLLRAHQLTAIDTNDEPPFAMDRDEWRAIRRNLPGTVGRSSAASFTVSFAMAVAVGNGRVRFDQVSVAIDRDDFSFTVERTTAGAATCTAPMHAVIGRPFEVAGEIRRAPLVRRGDWR